MKNYGLLDGFFNNSEGVLSARFTVLSEGYCNSLLDEKSYIEEEPEKKMFVPKDIWDGIFKGEEEPKVYDWFFFEVAKSGIPAILETFDGVSPVNVFVDSFIKKDKEFAAQLTSAAYHRDYESRFSEDPVVKIVKDKTICYGYFTGVVDGKITFAVFQDSRSEIAFDSGIARIPESVWNKTLQEKKIAIGEWFSFSLVEKSNFPGELTTEQVGAIRVANVFFDNFTSLGKDVP